MPEMPADLTVVDTSTPLPSSHHDHFVQTLAHLAGLTLVDFELTRARQALHHAASQPGEPIEHLQMAAAEIGIQISPARMTLADAVWKAHDMLPMVAWSSVENRWLVIHKHSFAKACVSSPESPTERKTLSRQALAKRLGLSGIQESADFGVVSAERPVQVAADMHSQGHAHASPVQRFLALMRPERRDIISIIIFSVITGVLYLALPLAVNALVSNLAFGGQSGPLWTALLIMAFALTLALMLSAVIRGMQYYMVEVIQRRLFVRMAADLSYRLPRAQMASLDGAHAPELVNRFLDVVTVQKSTALMLLDGINIVLSMLIGMIVLGFYHPFLLTFVILLLAMLVIVMLVLGRGAVRTSVQESIAKYDVVSWLEELARYPRLFKGPGGYQMAAEKADNLSRRYLENRRHHFHVLMRQLSGLLLIEVVASAALLIVGGWLVINQQLTLGQLVASELILGTIVASLSKLGKKFEAWYDALAAVDKLGHLVDIPTEREDGESRTANSGGAAVEVSSIGYTYPDGVCVFQGLSFQAKSGERIAIHGSQGSGASTLLDLIHGLRLPDSGFIWIDNLDLRSWYLESLRQHVALIRSDDIVQGSIVDNVRLGNVSISVDQVAKALERTGLLREVLEMPDGINTQLITGGLPLSSRQRTRLILARALVSRPRLLLLDEVFDGLDQRSQTELLDILLDSRHEWTVIVATRDPTVIARCHRFIDLDKPDSQVAENPAFLPS